MISDPVVVVGLVGFAAGCVFSLVLVLLTQLFSGRP